MMIVADRQGGIKAQKEVDSGSYAPCDVYAWREFDVHGEIEKEAEALSQSSNRKITTDFPIFFCPLSPFVSKSKVEHPKFGQSPKPELSIS